MTPKQISVYKLKPTKDRPHYKLEWVEPGTTRRRSRTAGTADEKAAERLRIELQYELNHGLHHHPAKMTWEDFCEVFMTNHAAGLRERTREKYTVVLRVFARITRVSKVMDITEYTITQFVRGLRERVMSRHRGRGRKPQQEQKPPKVGTAPMTIRNYLVVIKKALSWAVQQKIIPEVPAFPKIKVPKKKPQPIPKSDVAKLINHAPDYRCKAFLLCAWYAGLRLSEANCLRRRPSEEMPWVDFQRERIVLPAEFSKNGEDQWVPLHPILKTVLGKIPDDGDEYFPFISDYDGRPLVRTSLSKAIKRIAVNAGVKLTMHKLRKGFGCRVAQQLGKGNAPILHRLMRHSSMQVTMDYYASVDDVLNDAIKELK